MFLVAIILRIIPWLTNYPLHRDEALYGYWAQLIASGRDPLLLSPWVDKPPLVLYLLAADIRAFGASELALRLPGLIASLLLVLVTFGFARRAYGVSVALVAAGLRGVIEWLKAMCLRGELSDTADLSPFYESDGILLADHQRRITYVSGIAGSLYRRLGYREDFRGQRLTFLQSCDDEMAVIAAETRRAAERESETAGHIYIRKVLPVWPPADAARTGGGLAARSYGPGRRGRRADHGA